MRSMTGFATVERSGPERDVVIEIRSVNNRYLDVSVSLPSFLCTLEQEIKNRISTVAARGKVDVTVRLHDYREMLQVTVDHQAVEAAAGALREIGEIAGLSREPSYRDILSFEGVLRTERKHESTAHQEELMEALGDAIRQWDHARARDAESTRADIEYQIDRLNETIRIFSVHGPEVEQMVYRAVREKFREVLGDDIEEQRVQTEAAALILRHATNEEVVRLRSHVAALRELLDSSDTIGKRLDFICQEINREINTTGSKTILPVVQAAVVEAKDAVEAIREHVRNIE